MTGSALNAEPPKVISRQLTSDTPGLTDQCRKAPVDEVLDFAVACEETANRFYLDIDEAPVDSRAMKIERARADHQKLLLHVSQFHTARPGAILLLRPHRSFGDYLENRASKAGF